MYESIRVTQGTLVSGESEPTTAIYPANDELGNLGYFTYPFLWKLQVWEVTSSVGKERKTHGSKIEFVRLGNQEPKLATHIQTKWEPIRKIGKKAMAGKEKVYHDQNDESGIVAEAGVKPNSVTKDSCPKLRKKSFDLSADPKESPNIMGYHSSAATIVDVE